MTRHIGVLTLTLIAWRPLVAQSRDPRLDRLAPTIRPQVAAIVDSAHGAGLPTGPLIQKALEGTTKGASDLAVVSAVGALADALRAARGALGPRATGDELTAGAVALRVGASAQDLAALRAARAGRDLVVSLGVLSDLVARGVPADTAARVVLVLAARAQDAEYVAFRRGVARDITLGVPPIASAFGQLNASARATLLGGAKRP